MRRAWCLWLVLLAIAGCGGEPSSPAAGGAASPPHAPVASPGAKPSAGAPRPGIVELRRWRQPVERVVIDKGGVALGPASEPLVRLLFVSHERLQDLQFFLRTYAPFRMRSRDGELAFGGRGRMRASPVEQRMILEWVRLVAAEAAGARTSDAYGLALAWHRGGAAGSCDDVAVYLTGEVRARSCSWSSEMRGRLHPAQLARLYAWFEALKPLQAAGEAADQPARVIFAGRGNREATPEEAAVLRSLASALHRELAARRPAPPPPPAPVEEASLRGERKKPEKAAAPPPTPQGPPLLLPPERPVPMPLPAAKLPPYIPPPPRESLTPSPRTGVRAQPPVNDL